MKTQVVPDVKKKTVQDFVMENTAEGSTVYSDEAHAYRNMPNRRHEALRHSVGEYVRGMAHTNGLESHWAMLRRGHDGIFHHFSPKHLQRYVNEFTGRHNDRDSDTIDMMTHRVRNMESKGLWYKDLVRT